MAVFEDVWQPGQNLSIVMPELKLESFPVPFLPSLVQPVQQVACWDLGMSLPLLLSVPNRSQRSFLVGISLKC